MLSSLLEYPIQSNPRKGQNILRELPQLPSNHLLRNIHVRVRLPVVHRKLEPDEIRQDGYGTCARLDGGRAGGWGDGFGEGKTVMMQRIRLVSDRCS